MRLIDKLKEIKRQADIESEEQDRLREKALIEEYAEVISKVEEILIEEAEYGRRGVKIKYPLTFFRFNDPIIAIQAWAEREGLNHKFKLYRTVSNTTTEDSMLVFFGEEGVFLETTLYDLGVKG